MNIAQMCSHMQYNILQVSNETYEVYVRKRTRGQRTGIIYAVENDAVENVQMRAARIFLGVGRRHPLVSLQFEMDMLPVKWEALRIGIEFWVQVMRMNDDRLVKVVMLLEALEIGSKVKWIKDLQQSLEKLGWGGLNVVTLDGLTIKEVKQLLKDTVWRKVKAAWREKAKGSSNLWTMNARLVV